MPERPLRTNELRARRCELDAEAIQQATGGEIIDIKPIDPLMNNIGTVNPPGGGAITGMAGPGGNAAGWSFHRAARVGDRIYDLMTGRAGMTLDRYRQLFVDRDYLSFLPLPRP